MATAIPDASLFFPGINLEQFLDVSLILKDNANNTDDAELGEFIKTVSARIENLHELATGKAPDCETACFIIQGMWPHFEVLAADCNMYSLTMFNNCFERFCKISPEGANNSNEPRIENSFAMPSTNGDSDNGDKIFVTDMDVCNTEKPKNDFILVKNKQSKAGKYSEIASENICIDDNVAIRPKVKKMATQSPVGEALEEVMQLSNAYSCLNNEDYMDTNNVPGCSNYVSNDCANNSGNDCVKNVIHENFGTVIECDISKNNEYTVNFSRIGKNVTNVSDNVNSEPVNASDPPTKTVKPDPFWIQKDQQLPWREIIKEINKITETPLDLQDSGSFIKIFPKSIEQFRAIQKFVTRNNIKARTINPRSERPLKIVIKGIPADTDINDVKGELISLQFDVVRIAQLKRFKDKTPLPIFMCCLGKTDHLQTIYSVKNFLGFIVKIESYTFKGTKQCYNCLGFNHSSETCNLDPKCLKCAKSHKTSDCPKPNTEKATCANCGGDHPANFRGCPSHPDNIKNKKPLRSIKDLANRQNETRRDRNANTKYNSPRIIPYSDVVRLDEPSGNDEPTATQNNSPPNPTTISDQDDYMDNLNIFFLKIKEIERTLSSIKKTCEELGIDNIKEIMNFNGSQVISRFTAQNTH